MMGEKIYIRRKGHLKFDDSQSLVKREYLKFLRFCRNYILSCYIEEVELACSDEGYCFMSDI